MNSFSLPRLRTALRPFRLHWFPTLRSTSDHAAAMRKRGDLFAPAVVLTGRQTAGRGRGHHVWWSGPGCLTVTFVLPIDENISPHQLPLMAGLAVRNAAAELTGDDSIRLKWPNDLLHGPDRGLRKLAGLLCERILKADLVGLGLNGNLDPSSAPRDIRDRVTSLRAIAGRPLDMTEVLATVARHLRQAIALRAEQPFSVMLKEYDAHHALTGRRVTIVNGADAASLTGRCEGLDEIGRLLLRTRGVLHRVISGQVVME